MGRPKALLPIDGETLVERVARILASRAERVVLLGDGPVPDALDLPRCPDAPGCAGPVAGILAALRGGPAVRWMIVACDHAGLREEAVEWLWARPATGRIAVIPSAEGVPQPTFAIWEPEAAGMLEDLVAAGTLSPRTLAAHPSCATPVVPAALVDAWADVDTPEEWERLARGAQPRAARRLRDR
jgi:molybdopterin-guanine dinucleotide biosynthesis protein A